MKKTILLALMLVVAGCSFSKKSSDDGAVQTQQRQSRVDEVMNDSRYSNLQKVEVSIQKGMWDIFSAALPLVSADELNSITTDGETLGAIAMRFNRIDFLEALLKAGMSPFREAFTLDGKTWKSIDIYRLAVRMNNYDASGLIKKYRNQYFQESARLCATSLPELVSFLQKNSISPLEYVCGFRRDLFGAIAAMKVTDQQSISAVLNAFLNDGRSDSKMIFLRILETATSYTNSEILTRFDIYCSGERHCSVDTGFKVEFLVTEVEELAKNILIIKKSLRNNQQIALDIETSFLTGIWHFSEDDKSKVLPILERYNLKNKYDQLEVKVEPRREVGGALPPPPVSDEAGQEGEDVPLPELHS